MKETINIEYLWQDKKRHFGMPISFTTYSISKDRLFVKTGLINEKQEEVLLYRIKDITMTKSLGQKMFGVGSITLNTNDASSPTIKIYNIKNVEEVKELLHKNIESSKSKKGLAVTEIY